jgi:hypothetical protein
VDVTCTIQGVNWRDTSDPRNDPHLFGSLPPRDVVAAARQEGLTRYEVQVDVRGADLPGEEQPHRNLATECLRLVNSPEPLVAAGRSRSALRVSRSALRVSRSALRPAPLVAAGDPGLTSVVGVVVEAPGGHLGKIGWLQLQREEPSGRNDAGGACRANGCRGEGLFSCLGYVLLVGAPNPKGSILMNRLLWSCCVQRWLSFRHAVKRWRLPCPTTPTP